MRTDQRFFLPLFVAALVGAWPVFAGNIDQFLQDVTFTKAGQGISNALEMVELRLEKGGLGQADRAKVLECRIGLVAELAFRTRGGEVRDGLQRKAFETMETELFPVAGISPALKLRVYDRLSSLLAEPEKAGPWDVRFLDACRTALRDPSIAKDPAMKAAFLMRMADRQAARGCKDLAYNSYRAIAALPVDAGTKAAALFRAAKMARELRDLPASARCLDEVVALEGLPYEERKRALLFRAENAIFADEHSWKPDGARLAEARKFVAEALDARSPLLGTKEANETLLALVKAEAKGGQLAEAAKTGKEVLDGPLKDKVDWKTRANMAVAVADTLHEMGDYKGAIKYYEQAVSESDIGGKNVHRRIAVSARAGGDFFRAMQAYSDAIKFCDPVEGQDEIAHFAGLIKQMNKSVRKGSAAVDSDTMFSETNDELSGLTLDEE